MSRNYVPGQDDPSLRKPWLIKAGSFNQQRSLFYRRFFNRRSFSRGSSGGTTYLSRRRSG